MKPEAQRIALCEFAGWEPDLHFNEPIHWHNDTKIARCIEELPDVLHDLNAVHEVVMSLPKHKRNEMCAGLGFKCDKEGKVFVELTAADWTEALLRTLDLWVEDEE